VGHRDSADGGADDLDVPNAEKRSAATRFDIGGRLYGDLNHTRTPALGPNINVPLEGCAMWCSVSGISITPEGFYPS
jgi:hypothetical protein